MKLRIEKAWCATCKRETTWKGGKRVTCDGCGEKFPCAHGCKHYDCMEERGEVVLKQSREPRAENQEQTQKG